MSDLYPMQEIAPNSFIFAVDNAISLADCAVMVEKFEANVDQQYTGRIGENQQVAQQVKKSTDLRISGRENWVQYDALFRESMTKAIKSLSALYPFFSVNRFKDLGYNLQRTREGEYYHWHLDAGPLRYRGGGAPGPAAAALEPGDPVSFSERAREPVHAPAAEHVLVLLARRGGQDRVGLAALVVPSARPHPALVPGLRSAGLHPVSVRDPE